MASDAVPAADQNHHWHSPLRPGHPNTCPAHPQLSGAIRRGGRTHSEFLPGARETVHTVPACRPGASWPLSLVEAVVGTCPFAHHGLPAKAPQRNREWPRRNRSRAPETGLRFRQDSHALGTSPTPITGLGWHQGSPPTLDGPRPGTGWLQRTKPTQTAVCPAHPPRLPELTPRSAHVL